MPERIPTPPPEHPDDPLDSSSPPNATPLEPTSSSTKAPNNTKWLTWAIGSGAFAAFNGVFAKLTTTASTNTLSSALSSLLGLSAHNTLIAFLVRAIFFALNLVCNAIMWILFTRALTLASSTTRVSILNTSANFMVTAILGMLVFGEGLPFLWWMGAVLLVAGSVIIGMREEKEGSVVLGKGGEGDEDEAGVGAAVSLGTGGVGAGAVVVEGLERYRDSDSIENGREGLEMEGEYRDEDEEEEIKTKE